MISADDIDAFREMNMPAIKTAVKFVERAERGLPSDRWASQDEHEMVARAIKALFILVETQTAAIESMINE